MGAIAFDVTEGGLLAGKAASTREGVLSSLKQPQSLPPLKENLRELP